MPRQDGPKNLGLWYIRLKKLWAGISELAEKSADAVASAVLPKDDDSLGVENADPAAAKAAERREVRPRAGALASPCRAAWNLLPSHSGCLQEKMEVRAKVSVADISDPFERQTHYQDYETKGTFDDFNKMVIQVPSPPISRRVRTP